MSSFAGELEGTQVSGDESAGAENQEQASQAATEQAPAEGQSQEGAGEQDQTQNETPQHLQKRFDGLESALGESRKRAQEYRRELDYLRGRVESVPGQAGQEQPRQKPILTEDEFWTDPVAGAQKIAAATAQSALSRAEAARIDRASARMKAKHDDYADIEQRFLQACQFRPGLRDEALMADNPAEYVYEWGKAQQGGGDTAELKKRIAELEAQISGKKPATPPRTQAGGRSAGTSAAGGSEPDPFAKPY